MQRNKEWITAKLQWVTHFELSRPNTSGCAKFWFSPAWNSVNAECYCKRSAAQVKSMTRRFEIQIRWHSKKSISFRLIERRRRTIPKCQQCVINPSIQSPGALSLSPSFYSSRCKSICIWLAFNNFKKINKINNYLIRVHEAPNITASRQSRTDNEITVCL